VQANVISYSVSSRRMLSFRKPPFPIEQEEILSSEELPSPISRSSIKNPFQSLPHEH
jgi:hypothetical protein